MADLDRDGLAGATRQARSKYGVAPSQPVVKKSKAERVLGPSVGADTPSKPSKWSISHGAGTLLRKTSAASLAVQEFCTGLSLSARRTRRAADVATDAGVASPGSSVLHLYPPPRPHTATLSSQRYDVDRRAQSMRASTLHPSARVVDERRSKSFTGLMRTLSRSKTGREAPGSSGSTMKSVSSMSITSADDILHKPKWTPGMFARESSVPAIPRSEKFYENQSYRSPERRHPTTEGPDRAEARPPHPRPRNLAQVEEETTEASPASSSDSIRTLTSAHGASDARATATPPATRAKPPTRQKGTGRARLPEHKSSIYRPSALRVASGAASRITSNDLQIASVLSLSSSDDESDTDKRPVLVFRPGASPVQPAASPAIPRHKVPPRSKSSRSNATTPRAGPRHSHSRSTSTRKTSVSFDPSLSDAKVSDGKRSSPLKQRSHDGKRRVPSMFLAEDSIFSSPPSTVDGELSSPPSSRPSSSTRFVAVTKEEEALLESMRQKRATLTSSAAVTATAPPSHVSGLSAASATARPKTADANTGPRYSWLLDDENAAPFPHLPTKLLDGAIGTPHRHHSPGPSLSQVELRIAEDLPFLERASVLHALNGFRGGLGATTTGVERSGDDGGDAGSTRDAERASDTTLTPTVVHAYSSLEEKSGLFAPEHARVVKEADDKAELVLTQWAMETETKLRQMSP